MPFVTIDLPVGTTAEFREAVSTAIHRGMVEVLGTKDEDRLHAFYEHPAATFLHDEVLFGAARGAGFLFVRLYLGSRPTAMKQALFAAMAAALDDIAGVAPDEVAFLILDTAPDAWWAKRDSA